VLLPSRSLAGGIMIISRTPFRISFVGGGTDFKDYYKINGGAVISTTINKYVYITVNSKFDNKIHLRYSEVECVDRIDDLKHDIVREALRMTDVKGGVEIVIISDIPTKGSGIGSSSSLSVGLLKALSFYTGKEISTEELAQKACELEIERLRSPIGKQDQYIAAYGGFSCIQFESFEDVFVSSLALYEKKMDWLRKSTMLFYLGSRPSNPILETHKKNILSKQDILDKQKELVFSFKEWLSCDRDDFQKVGDLITDSWSYKKIMTPQATSKQTDDMFLKVLHAGAFGAKLCGAGGGGFLMVLCDEENQQNVRNTLSSISELKFDFEKKGSEVIYASA
jgi:D-glycero-alpha-D-manno-heptose-7-phosphate kinase